MSFRYFLDLHSASYDQRSPEVRGGSRLADSRWEGLLLGGIAVDQAIPLGRVWSFPTELRPATLIFNNCKGVDAFGFATLRTGDIVSFGGMRYAGKTFLLGKAESSKALFYPVFDLKEGVKLYDSEGEEIHGQPTA